MPQVYLAVFARFKVETLPSTAASSWMDPRPKPNQDDTFPPSHGLLNPGPLRASGLFDGCICVRICVYVRVFVYGCVYARVQCLCMRVCLCAYLCVFACMCVYLCGCDLICVQGCTKRACQGRALAAPVRWPLPRVVPQSSPARPREPCRLVRGDGCRGPGCEGVQRMTLLA